jgi:tetratricopeptide (TPR) repeat protein/tRNA A-37 threonylcarbamoyl transferase component Bud32
MAVDQRMLDLLQRFEELLSQGQCPTPEELCRDCPELLDEVRRRTAGLRALDPLLNTDAGATAPGGPAVSKAPAAGFGDLGRQRYRPLHFHAKGGLGEVLVAADEELHREVALKVIQQQYRNDPESRRSFLREAEITARLEHPGVVPVHGLVEGDDGQPCYAMRFIRGETLGDAIKAFHEADRKPGRDPGERSLALRQLLGRFVAVCNTVAYAHSRGVIHRDLKPSNIMLGKYGETLVVDWGLAKPFETPPLNRSRDEEVLALTPATDAEGATRTGDVKGTPAYMSPEQAVGRVHELGPSSDIYSLGATLYVLLTGQAPVRGGNKREVLEKACRADFPPPRLVKPAVPCALEAICLKAMEAEPARRHDSALSLADDVEKWLADEPVTAYREPWRLRARRWARRHKPLVAGMAGAVLITAIGALAGAWWYQRLEAARAERAARTEGEVEQALAEARILGKQARAQAAHFDQLEKSLRVALSAARRAQALLNAGEAEGWNWPGLRKEVRELNEELAARAERAGQAAEQAARDRAMQGELERIRLEQTASRAGEFDKEAALPLFAPTFRKYGIDVERLPDAKAAALLGASAIKGDLLAALDEWALRRKDEAGKKRLTRIAQAVEGKAGSFGHRLRQARLAGNTAELKQLAHQADVQRLPPATLVHLAEALEQRGERSTAVRLLNAARVHYAGDFWVNHDLGNYLWGAEPLPSEQVIACFRAALAARPRSQGMYLRLGVALKQQGRLDDAIALIHKAIEINPRYGPCFNNLGNALRARKDLAGAVRAYRRAIKIDDRVALPYCNLGLALFDQKDIAGAARAYRQAIQNKPLFAEAHNYLGSALFAQNDRAGALRAYRRAIQINPGYADAHYNLGNALYEQQDFDGAVRALRQAVRFDSKLSQAYYSLGLALHGKKDVAGAVQAYRHATQINPKFGEAYYNLGTALLEQNEFAEAVSALHAYLEINPTDARGLVNLGNALQVQKDLVGAVRAYRRAIAIDPGYADAYYNLGNALHVQKDLAGAVQAYRRATQLNPKCDKAYNNLGIALRAQKDLAGAVHAYRQAIRTNPTYAEAYFNLGHVLNDRKDLEGAVEAYRQAIQLNPKLAEAYLCLGHALHEKLDLAGAEQAYRKAIQVNPNYAKAYFNLGLIRSANKDPVGAVQLYRRAIRINPHIYEAHLNLGGLLRARKDWSGAVEAYRQAIRINPKDARGYNGLGTVLADQMDRAGAGEAYRKAIEIDPNYAQAFFNLGITLRAQNDVVGAERAQRRAIQINPRYAEAYTELGITRYSQNDLPGAVAAYRRAIELNPRLPEAHLNLGVSLYAQGQYARSIEAMQQGSRFLAASDSRLPLVRQHIRISRRQVQLETSLPAVLSGKEQPRDVAEVVEYARLCTVKHWYAASAGLWNRVLAADAKLADNPLNYHRYHAACSAALAGCGQGKDVAKLSEADRARLRQQALTWLQADLEAWGKVLSKSPDKARATCQETLQHWQQYAALAGVRGEALRKLPTAERRQWDRLWLDVEAMRQRIMAGKTR